MRHPRVVDGVENGPHIRHLLRRGGGRVEPAFDRSARPFDRFGGAGDDVLRVGEEEGGLDLERELRRVFGKIDRAFGLRFANRRLDPRQPLAEKGDQTIANRAGLHVHLGQCRGEEATAREGLDL